MMTRPRLIVRRMAMPSRRPQADTLARSDPTNVAGTPHSATCAGHYAEGSMVSKTSMSSVALRYRNVAVASDWLCTAFGFQSAAVAVSGTQLSLGQQRIDGL